MPAPLPSSTPRAISPTVPLDREQDGLAGFRAVLANLADAIVVNVPGTIADTDPECLHELRVAIRRTRSVLAEGKGVLPTEVRAHYRERFGWLGEITGPPRDLDVQLLRWDEDVAALPPDELDALDVVRVELETRRAAAHHTLNAALEGGPTTDLLDAWQRWLDDPTVKGMERSSIGTVVARRIHKAQATVLRDGRAIDAESPGERLHDLRKDAKKLRYLLECFGSLFPGKARKRFIAQLKALQDNLGAHQDAEVHVAVLRDLARDLHGRADIGADVPFAIGRLAERLDQRRIEEREVFGARFADYDTKANRRALKALLNDAVRAR